MKPIIRGLREWVLGDSHNGISKSLRSTLEKKGFREFGLGVTVVKTIANHLKGNFHHNFFDNFFTCLKLLDLEANGL